MTEQAQGLARLCKDFAVDSLYVFGSRAREAKSWHDGLQPALTAGPQDVDVGVKPILGLKLSALQKARLALALEDLFGANRVDLVVLPEADPFLAANVVRGERLYAQDDYRADEFELYILRRAGDLAPLERERMALILGRAP
jgi:predicted nucleotidyltransferase